VREVGDLAVAKPENDLRHRKGSVLQHADTMKANADGSYDVYFAPEAPEGKEANWIPTGEDFFLLFRLYGPDGKDWFKTWMLGDLEKVD